MISLQSSIISKLRGFVTVEVRGERREELVNAAAAGGFSIWDVKLTRNERLEMNILLRDFFRLRPLLKRTGCRIHVKARFGFPFFLDKLGHRKMFVVGGVAFFIGLYILSSLVWNVQVQGNVKITEDQIMKAAAQEGIYRFQWKFRLDDADVLSRRLQNHLPGAAWVGVEKQGTSIMIKVVEATVPEDKPLNTPRHFVSNADAVVTEIIAEKGKPLVRKNMRVKKGDILISGITGGGDNTATVVAQGKVRGLVWHEYEIAVPLLQRYKVYTGESKVRQYAVFGDRALKVSGFGKLEYAQYESIVEREKVGWRGYSLPIGWMKEKIMEFEYLDTNRSPEEAKAIGLEQARADLLVKAGRDAAIKEEKILHEKTESGKVYMKVLFEIEQNIAKEQPLVHIQGE